jgi:hypothetical protein
VKNPTQGLASTIYRMKIGTDFLGQEDLEGCIYSDPPHDQQVSLEPFGLPRTQDELRRRPAPKGGDTSPNQAHC